MGGGQGGGDEAMGAELQTPCTCVLVTGGRMQWRGGSGSLPVKRRTHACVPYRAEDERMQWEGNQANMVEAIPGRSLHLQLHRAVSGSAFIHLG